MKFGVITFPGSNCDHDMVHVLRDVTHNEVNEIWHRENTLPDFGIEDCVVIPGGFSYGDYVRAGAIARLAPIMEAVIQHANQGGLVWGICNGFQILCEAQLLPGILVRNAQQKFIGKDIYLRVETNNSLITNRYRVGRVLRIPIAHAEGRFIADQETIDRIEANDQVLFRYCDENGVVHDAANVNGSTNNIAGICNEGRNVFGMMPHPERASEEALGNTDGLLMFLSMIERRELV
jgi:phosphoribosylformylglycinamidine synthase